ncbi:hypothetical protein GH714_019438 [Hevea brasiliensis]|uniref:Uncharacterized protein n=1 Tax=Hevea brasiliensis TaxID=3981 RepID=A0A6A6KQX6_HEVBR|nr:hypothetical protein GH714_019438 [Hevea brasiliensis]
MPTIPERRRNLQDIAKEKWKSVIEFYKKYPDCLLDTLNTVEDTVFHMAMHSKTKKPFVTLKEIAQPCSMGDDFFFKRNGNGNTILHEAAATGNTEMFDSQFDYNLFYLPMHADTALLLLKLYESLWPLEDNESLWRLEDNESLWRLENDKRPWLLKDTHGRTIHDALANMPSAFKSGHTMGVFESLLYKCLPVHDETETEVRDILGQSSMREQDLEMGGSAVTTEIAIEHKVLKENNHNQSIWKFMKGWPMVGKIWEEKRKHTFTLKLARSLIKLTTDPERCQTLLFTATEMGIVEIVRETIQEYPEVIDRLNDKLQNILHVAVLHRRKEIFHKLRGYMGEIQWKRMTEAFAADGYTLLHLVASTEFYTEGTRPGPALQLQEELMWFEDKHKSVSFEFIQLKFKLSVV